MIGIFDSGIGGLTVVKEMFKQLPEYQIIYFGDTARTPYGTKSQETIRRYSVENTEFLLKHGAKIIVIACNSASAAAAEQLKKLYPQVPIFEVVMPAVEQAVKITQNKRIGLIGTMATISSGLYEKKIKQLKAKIKVFNQACPLLVPLAEEGWERQAETKTILRKYLMPLKMKNIDTLILGCTHYPFFKSLIAQKMGRSVKLVDSAEEVVKSLSYALQNNENLDKILTKGQDHCFYVSDKTDKFQQLAGKWLKKPQIKLLEHKL